MTGSGDFAGVMNCMRPLTLDCSKYLSKDKQASVPIVRLFYPWAFGNKTLVHVSFFGYCY